MHPTKTFVFAGTPRPRMTRENNYAAPSNGGFFTGCGGWVHGTARFLLPSLSMHCKTFVPVQIQELILCHIRILIIFVRVCAAFLPHRFVLFLRFCVCGAVFDRCMNYRPVSFFSLHCFIMVNKNTAVIKGGWRLTTIKGNSVAYSIYSQPSNPCWSKAFKGLLSPALVIIQCALIMTYK